MRWRQVTVRVWPPIVEKQLGSAYTVVRVTTMVKIAHTPHMHINLCIIGLAAFANCIQIKSTILSFSTK